MRKYLWTGALVAVTVVLIAAWWLGGPDRQTGEAPQPAIASSSDPLTERSARESPAGETRGRELVVLADCQSCHTARGGAKFAGGRPIPTPFGTFYSPNITPDAHAGLGSWSSTDFWHALHNGYSKDGTLLYPTFPYTNYTRISRSDSDAIYAYLRTVAPAATPNRPHRADCHGDKGEGHEPAAPPLAGNRTVNMPVAVNAIRIILFGGYSPGTAGNPRPFGMPPYSLTLSDEQIALLLDYVRTSWGNSAAPVMGEEVGANRGNPLW